MATATTAVLPTSGLLCSLPVYGYSRDSSATYVRSVMFFTWLRLQPPQERYLRQDCYVLYLAMAKAATRTALPTSGHALYLGMATAAATAALPTSGLLCFSPRYGYSHHKNSAKSGLLCSLPGYGYSHHKNSAT